MGFLPGTEDTLVSLITSFLLGFTTLVLLYWYSTRTHGYWKKRGVPYTPAYPIIGSLLENFQKSFHIAEIDRYKKYGAIYGHFEGTHPMLSVGDPSLLRDIFVKDFHAFTGRRIFNYTDDMASKMISIIRGEDWKRIRTIITPTFTTGKIKRMLSIFKDCSNTLVQNFKKEAEKGLPVDVKSIYGAFTMDVIASCCFSTKIDSQNDPNNKFVTYAKNSFTKSFQWRFILFLLCPSLMSFLKVSLFDPKLTKFFKDVTLQIIEERKKTGQKRNDFLQLLLDTTEELQGEGKLEAEQESEDITENYGKDDSQEIFKSSYTKIYKSLSADELVAQSVIFFLAGYETTGTALTLASYLLALNEDVQEKLAKEVEEVIKENDGKLTYEAIQNMKYLDNVISETLRIYPPASRVERLADEDYKLGDTGITIPKGILVSIPVCAIHMDSKYYPNPEKFDPDRFTPEERKKRDQYTYLPFGHGPRNCVGLRFALMEMKVCLAQVINNFKIKRCSETMVPLEFRVGQGILQTKKILLKLELRNDDVKIC